MIKKADIILIVAILTLTLSGIAVFALTKQTGSYAVITSGSSVYGCYPIDHNCTIKVNYGDDYNIVSIKNGKVTVSESTCRDKICVNHAAISSVGESIVCLPDKLVVEIKDKADG